jgi:hypothetical protein
MLAATLITFPEPPAADALLPVEVEAGEVAQADKTSALHAASTAGTPNR